LKEPKPADDGKTVGALRKTRRLTRRTYRVRVNLTAPVYDALMNLIDSGTHLSISKYLEDLIINHLESMGTEFNRLEDYVEAENVERRSKVADSGVVSTRLPKPVINLINGLVNSGLFLKVSDYLRYIVMKDLEKRGALTSLLKANRGEEKPSKTRRPSDAILVSIMVPASMMDELDELIESGLYIRVSDYLIDLIRKDLEAKAKLN